MRSGPFFGLGGSEFQPAPAANADIQFRRLKPHTGSNLTVGDVNRVPELRIVGRYDPRQLAGFNPLSRVPLETYYPPQLEPADESSRDVLGGRPLAPSQNLGDYVQQPPLLLTTLEGMRPFLNPVFFKGARGRAKAPISVIRVGWRLANVQKGNFVAVRNGQTDEVESQAAATLSNLVEAVRLREEVLSRQATS